MVEKINDGFFLVFVFVLCSLEGVCLVGLVCVDCCVVFKLVYIDMVRKRLNVVVCNIGFEIVIRVMVVGINVVIGFVF